MLRDQLIACFRRGVEASLPGPAVERALAEEGLPPVAPYVIAVGKAAVPMARAAVEVLTRAGRRPAGGLVVAPVDAPPPQVELPLTVCRAEHPLPGAGSRDAAERLGQLAAAIPPGAPVWFLLSGGASSLLGGPDHGLPAAALDAAWRFLLTSGLDITAMNAVRKRLTRWGGGKLARALAHTSVLQLVVSDVIGDDLAAIGSGPLVPDAGETAAVVAELQAQGHWSHLPEPARRVLADMATGRRPPLPSAGDAAFQRVRTRVIVSNQGAVRATAAAGREAGWLVEIEPTPLAGEARVAGVALARRLLNHPGAERPVLLVQGGEPTVTIPPGGGGRGGRAQELALAAAELLAAAPPSQPTPCVLAAGTDGRDGPTDAAGALVDGDTWARAVRAGVDPARALAAHDAYTALDAAGALLRTGPTGTNVMDVVLGLIHPRLTAGFLEAESNPAPAGP
jgi:hydroxypyruvate reductase